MNLIELTNSIVVCQDRSYYQVNMVCVHLGSELVFIDTCTDIKLAKEFRKSMEKKYNQKEGTLIITHANRDHFNAISAFNGFPVFFSEAFIERVKQYRVSTKIMQILLQAQTFSEEITFGSKDHKLLFRYVGGHTDDSIYGFYPSEKIIIAGDNLISNMPQYFPFTDTDLKKWINCLKIWEQLDVEKFICGHGGIVGKNHVIKVRTFFENLYDVLVNSMEKNLVIEEILTRADLPRYFEEDPDEIINPSIQFMTATNLTVFQV
ncbi:MAG: MBL fold metallo-hydrolase [Candidatus Hodarchaeota archaeon]